MSTGAWRTERWMELTQTHGGGVNRDLRHWLRLVIQMLTSFFTAPTRSLPLPDVAYCVLPL